MSYYLNDHYIDWLKRYHKQENREPVKKIIGDLIISLPQSQSVEEMLLLLTPNLSTNNDVSTPVKSAVYGPMTFYAKLLEWHKQLTDIQNDLVTAKKNLQTINIESINPLIRLTFEIITTPKLLLHHKMPSVLNILSHDELPAILKYIACLEAVPPPISPQPGSFAAIVPFDQDHKVCLDLLNNVSAQYSGRHPMSELWDTANGLLQNTLLIFQDLHPQKLILEEEQEQTGNICGCTLF